jgi:hypothetical protein
MVNLPWLNKISGQDLPIDILYKWQIIVPLLLIPFVVGVISGIYPALFMSSFQPIKVLKGFLKAGGGISFRKALVTFNLHFYYSHYCYRNCFLANEVYAELKYWDSIKNIL